MNSNGGDRGGDILERAVGKKKLGSGNAGKLSTSNTTTQTNPLFPNFGPGPIMGPNGQINPAFSAYNNIAGPMPATIAGFDWGLPFFFGRRLTVAFEGPTTTSAGAGPFFAYADF